MTQAIGSGSSLNPVLPVRERAANEPPQSPMQSMPPEILQKILLFVPDSPSTSLVCKRWLAFENDSNFVLERICLFQNKLGIGREVRVADKVGKTSEEKLNAIKNQLISRVLVEGSVDDLSKTDRERLTSENTRVFSVFKFLSSFERCRSLVTLWGALQKSEHVKCESLSSIPVREQALFIREQMSQRRGEMALVKKLDLRSKCISRLPKELSLLTGLEEIKLDHNSFYKISAKLLNSWKNLKSFSMAHAGVETLPEEFGEAWQELDSLNLSGNNLTLLPDRFFQHFPKLTCLKLENNKLESLPETFGISWNRLERVTLQFNNLKALSPTILELRRRLTVFKYDA